MQQPETHEEWSFFKYSKLKLYLSMKDYISSRKISMGKCGDTYEYHFNNIEFDMFSSPLLPSSFFLEYA